MWYVVQKSPQSLLQIMKPSQQSAAVSRCQQNAPDSDLLQPPIQTSWMLPEHLPRTGLLQTPQVRLGGKLDRYRSKMKVKWLIYPPRGYLLEYNGLEQPNKECIAKLMPPGKKKTTLPPFTWQIAMLEPCFAGRNLGGYGSVQATPKIHWTNFDFTGIPVSPFANTPVCTANKNVLTATCSVMPDPTA